MQTYSEGVANVLTLPGIREALDEDRAAIGRLAQVTTSPALRNFLTAFQTADVCASTDPASVDTGAALEAIGRLPSLAQAVVVELTDCLAYFRAITKGVPQ